MVIALVFKCLPSETSRLTFPKERGNRFFSYYATSGPFGLNNLSDHGTTHIFKFKYPVESSIRKNDSKKIKLNSNDVILSVLIVVIPINTPVFLDHLLSADTSSPQLMQHLYSLPSNSQHGNLIYRYCFLANYVGPFLVLISSITIWVKRTLFR